MFSRRDKLIDGQHVFADHSVFPVTSIAFGISKKKTQQKVKRGLMHVSRSAFAAFFLMHSYLKCVTHLLLPYERYQIELASVQCFTNYWRDQASRTIWVVRYTIATSTLHITKHSSNCAHHSLRCAHPIAAATQSGQTKQ